METKTTQKSRGGLGASLRALRQHLRQRWDEEQSGNEPAGESLSVDERVARETRSLEHESTGEAAIWTTVQSEGEREARMAEDEYTLSVWRERLDEYLEERNLRKSRHATRLRENYEAIEHLTQVALQTKHSDVPEGELPLKHDSKDFGGGAPKPAVKPPPKPPPEPFPAEALAAYEMPALELLRRMDEARVHLVDEDELDQQKRRLQDTFDSFAIDAQVVDALVGPRVTRYRVRPGFGVRVETIAGLDRNIGLKMAATSVRIQAPIPGENYVGIELPNANSVPLTLRAALESEEWRGAGGELPMALGMDITGQLSLCDLARAPHLLIAGATGSGKSVCLNNLILSLLYLKRPDELELILVDPKRVEFAMYKDLPHLIHPIVNDGKEAVQALKWLVKEMETRYEEMALKKVRNLAGYNAKAAAEGFKPLPHIVLIIDELADLMMTAAEDVETPIARLAQMSRAVGIHTILATQRPSVNVITGTIKANFPTRIAFQVSSQVDSRTILDGKGAEALQGKGDMLYNPPGLSRLLRLQAPYVDDAEIETVTASLKAQLQPRYRVELPEDENAEQSEMDLGPEGDNQLIKQALRVIHASNRASTSYLQRKLKIGYNRAASLMEEIESRGYVGPQVGTAPREIFIQESDL